MEKRIVYWGGSPGVLEYYSIATALSVLCLIIFHFSYMFFWRSGGPLKFSKIGGKIHSSSWLLILSLISSFTIYLYNGFSISSVFVRGGDVAASRVSLSQLQWLIYQYFIYPMPTVSLIVYILFCKKKPIVSIILFFMFIMANPATGMARFQAAALYIGVLVSVLPMILNYRSVMISIFFFGMFFVFPVLDLFRMFSSETSALSWSWSSGFLYSGNFDSFQSFARVLEAGIVTYGYQLIGALLFFVPRSVWLDKPSGSGAFVAEASYLDFSNISMNFFGEGYINFGIVGVIIFPAFLAYVCSFFDKGYWRLSSVMKPTFRAFYAVSFGMLFFLLRGDLLSALSYTVGLASSIFLAVFLSGLRVRSQI